MANSGAHGLSEIVSAATSTTQSNRSSFRGLSGNTPFYNLGMCLTMLIGRYLPTAFVLAPAGKLAGASFPAMGRRDDLGIPGCSSNRKRDANASGYPPIRARATIDHVTVATGVNER